MRYSRTVDRRGDISDRFGRAPRVLASLTSRAGHGNLPSRAAIAAQRIAVLERTAFYQGDQRLSRPWPTGPERSAPCILDKPACKLAYQQEKAMREIGAFQAKNTFGTLLDWVADGEEVTITRRGKPAARLVPFGATIAQSSHRASTAIARIRVRAKSAGFAPVTQSEWETFRNEGHR